MGGDFDLIKVILIAAVVFIAVARAFIRIFIKPFMPDANKPAAPKPGEKTARDLKEFLSELRRDLGHGNLPPPKTDMMLEDERALQEEAAQQARQHLPPPPPLPPPPLVPASERPPLTGTIVLEHQPPASRKATPHATHVPPHARQKARRRGEKQVEQQRPEEALASTIKQEAVEAAQAGFEETVTDVMLDQQGAGSAQPDSLLGVEVERAVILNEVLGPPRSRLGPRRFGPRSPLRF